LKEVVVKICDYPDPSLTCDDHVVFQAGSHDRAIHMRMGDYLSLAQPEIADIAYRPDEGWILRQSLFSSCVRRDPGYHGGARHPWIGMIDIGENTFISEDALVFRTSRSSGPGGQNVNKLNTRVTVLFDVSGSASLSEDQKRRIASRLSTRLDRHGVLHVVSQKHRSQEANRRAALDRLQQLLQGALKPVPIRRKTGVPAAARARRLEEKKRHSRLKSERARRDWSQ
jgi:ribosome-associated protein